MCFLNQLNNKVIIMKKIVLFVLFVFMFTACDEDSSNVNVQNEFNVLMQGKEYSGKSYGEWSAEWWKWVLSMPKDSHPLFDNAPAGKNQPENLWFLGGTVNFLEDELDKTIERTITVPYGKALFIPVTTVMMAKSLGDPEDSLDILARNWLVDFDELYCEINGKKINNIESYKFETGSNFSYTLPENNIFNLDAGLYEEDAYAVGYYVILTDIDKGNYTIRFYTRQDWADYIQDVIYYISVE